MYTREERLSIHKKQERTQKKVRKGVPLASDLDEIVPEIRLVGTGLHQFVKVNGVIYSSPLAMYPRGELSGVIDGDNYVKKAYVDKKAVQTKVLNVYDASPTAGYHYVFYDKINIVQGSLDLTVLNLGNSADPLTEITVTSNANVVMNCYWYIPSDIRIHKVTVLCASDAAQNVNYHLMSYDVVSGTGSTAGDLSNGTVIADGSTDSSAAKINIQDLTLYNQGFVGMGQIVIGCWETDDTDDFSGSLNIKYEYI